MRQTPEHLNTGPRWPRVVTLTLLVAALLGWVAWLWATAQAYPQAGQPNHQQSAQDTPPAQVAPVQCVSYAPFRRQGHAPWVANLVVSEAQITEDLRLLRPLTTCVRTYGVDRGLAHVPAAARALGMKVMLGVWLGRDDHINREQLNQGLALARAYPDVVDLLVVGNEVLLRREQSPEGLAHWLAQARAASPVPVAYADVWEFWQRHAPTLRPHVDVVAAHILPYWEDEPVAVQHAVAHVHRIAAQLETHFAPLPVLIAETGWPAAGRQRGAAVPGVAEQQRFVRDLLAHPPQRYNLIEGFDQPWKRALEGAMGGHWGLLEADGRQRVTLQDHAPPPDGVHALWWWTLGGAVVGALAMRVAHRTWRCGWPVASLVGALTLPWAVLQWHMLHTWSRSPLEAWLGGLYALLALWAAVWGGGVLATLSAGRVPLGRTRRWLGGLHLALLFATAWVAMGLVFDGRYRPLVWPLLAAGAGVLALLPTPTWPDAEPSPLQRWAVQARGLALVCGLAAPLLWWQEGLANTQAWAAGLMWVCLAVATHRQLRGCAGGAGAHAATQPQPANNTANAPRSAE